MKEAYRLKGMLAAFLESDAGKLLILKLGEQRRYIRLACGESCMSMTPVYYLNGDGLRTSIESSALAAAFTKTSVTISNPEACSVDDAVNAIEQQDQTCCPESFMYWLEKCTVEKDGIPLPEGILAAAA